VSMRCSYIHSLSTYIYPLPTIHNPYDSFSDRLLGGEVGAGQGGLAQQRPPPHPGLPHAAAGPGGQVLATLLTIHVLRVLVPLCGKAGCLLYLYNAGHTVVGEKEHKRVC
jgi:hypothetical protein